MDNANGGNLVTNLDICESNKATASSVAERSTKAPEKHQSYNGTVEERATVDEHMLVPPAAFVEKM